MRENLILLCGQPFIILIPEIAQIHVTTDETLILVSGPRYLSLERVPT